MVTTKSEKTGSILKTGFFEGKVVMINPTREQMCAWRGWEVKDDDKEIEYLGEDKDNNAKMTIEFCIESLDGHFKTTKQFSIVDKKVPASKSGDNPGKLQYVNSQGNSTWVLDVKDLKDNFTHKLNKEKVKVQELNYRLALVGEADFYSFLQNWLPKMDYFGGPDVTDILQNPKDLFRGNISDLQTLLKEDELTSPAICMLATVYSKEKEGVTKHYQNTSRIYASNVYKSSIMKSIRVAIESNSWDSSKDTKYIKEQLEKNEKSAYTLTLLQEFVEGAQIQTGNETLQHSAAESDVEDASY